MSAVELESVLWWTPVYRCDFTISLGEWDMAGGTYIGEHQLRASLGRLVAAGGIVLLAYVLDSLSPFGARFLYLWMMTTAGIAILSDPNLPGVSSLASQQAERVLGFTAGIVVGAVLAAGQWPRTFEEVVSWLWAISPLIFWIPRGFKEWRRHDE